MKPSAAIRTLAAALLFICCVLMPAGAASLVSQGKTATQSSTSYGGVASRAVDGNTSGVYGNNSVTASGVEAQPWWQVDVGQTYGITQVTLWNRTDSCCVSRLSNFYVFVSNSDMTGRTLAQLTADSTVSNQFVATMPGVSLTLSFARTGRYVRVQRNGVGATNTDEDILSLAEVQVYGNTLLGAYSFEQSAWNGAAGDVDDSSGNGLDATSAGLSGTLPSTSRASPAVGTSTGTCRYGVFNRSNKQYISLPSTFPDLSSIGSFTATAWIRTTDRTQSNQRILIQDESGYNTNSTGWFFSLGDYGAGTLVFYTRATGSPGSDKTVSGAVISNNTWYFVVFGINAATKGKFVYVYDTAGTLLSQATSTYTGNIGPVPGPITIGGETNSAGGNENTGSYGFGGNIDEVRVYSAVLSGAEISAVQALSSPCVDVDHYELTLPSSSLACLTSAVSVQACYDSSSPCTNPSTALSGQTATLAASAGATLGATQISFNASGYASTTLSYPSASNGATVTVTLSGEATAAVNPRKCCPNGASCSAANSCTTTFNTAGFIVSASVGGTTATVPAQTAGTASGTYYLRAVQTNTSTQACQAAITGSTTVGWGYQCNNPTTCSAGSLMTLTGNSGTSIGANPNSGVSTYVSVPMTFDANGNAPFTFNYADVGQVTLWATKAASGSLLAALSGSSNAFVVKPGGFTVSGIKQTAAPQLANPAAASAAGSKFVKAGEAFTATVTAQTSGGATTPNYGRETSAEGVLLTRTLVLPAAGTSGTLSNATIAGGSFSSGVATVTNLAFSEVGIITLAPAVADGDYLGAGSVTGTTTGNIGRFVPAQFALSSGSVTHRSALSCSPSSTFSYLGENFRLGFTLTAQNSAGATTTNYTGTFAKLDPTSASGWNLAGLGGTTTFSVGSGRLSLGSASGSFSNGVASGITLTANASRAATPDGPFSAAFGVAPSDSDGVAMAAFDMASTSGGANDRTTVGTVALRFGRLRLFTAMGAADRTLSLPAAAQFWTGSAWDTNTLDSCTAVPTTAVNFGNPRKTIVLADLVASAGITISNGQGALKLATPTGGHSGTYDVALSLGSSTTDASCLQTWTPTRAATVAGNLAYLRGAWCGGTYDKDPMARASFGLQRTQENIIFRRENH